MEIAASLPSLPSVGGGRPWRRATAWLIALGAFFYASYGFSNWLASQRSDVPVVMFDWERAIPFIAWTIIPYWSTNFFFALSLFLCRDTSELDTHVRRLFTAQVIAVACFLAFPLRTTFIKPQTDGVPGFLFETLGALDMPFNQAPSLHVAITTILFALYARVLPKHLLIVFSCWSMLVVGSVLTTWQHHFVDVPTGFLLGLLCIWSWPWRSANRLTGWRTSLDPKRRTLAIRYAVAASLLAILAAVLGGGFLWLLWPAVALGAASLAYAGFGATLFAKGPDGKIDGAARLLLAPYLAGAWLNSRLWTRNEPRIVEITDGVLLGRFPSASDCEGMNTIVDLTCEFSCPAIGQAWHSIPMLDLVAPDAASLQQAAEAIEAARLRGPVLVCCALGYGRSVAALAVWLVRTRRAEDLPAALRHLERKRPKLALNAQQISAIAEAILAA